MVGAERTVLEDDPRAVAVVGHPVGLQLEGDGGHDRDGEQPVEVGRIQAIDDVGEPDRRAALEPSQQVDDPHGRERIARFGDGRRHDAGSGSP